MFEFYHTLSDGRIVRIVNQSGTSWGYDIYDPSDKHIGTIWTGDDDGTEDELLKPFEQELLDAIYNYIKPDL